MSRVVKRLLLLGALVLLLSCAWIGWHLLRIEAASHLVIWQTKEGGLTLSYFPLKDQAFIFVGSDYVQASSRTWTMTDPGTTNWIIAAPAIPAPDRLFGRAAIGQPDASLEAEPQADRRFGLTSSSGKGLARLYADVSDLQRQNIVQTLEFACDANPSFCDALQHVEAAAQSNSEQIQYISDPSRFKSENDATLNEQESQAIAAAKRHLKIYFGKQFRATFAVSSAEWGYQVDFTDVYCVAETGGRWERVPEGFGEVFLSKELDVLRACVGP